MKRLEFEYRDGTTLRFVLDDSEKAHWTATFACFDDVHGSSHRVWLDGIRRVSVVDGVGGSE